MFLWEGFGQFPFTGTRIRPTSFAGTETELRVRPDRAPPASRRDSLSPRLGVVPRISLIPQHIHRELQMVMALMPIHSSIEAANGQLEQHPGCHIGTERTSRICEDSSRFRRQPSRVKTQGTTFPAFARDHVSAKPNGELRGVALFRSANPGRRQWPFVHRSRGKLRDLVRGTLPIQTMGFGSR